VGRGIFRIGGQAERIRDYEKWGAPLERDESGHITRMVGRGHVSTRLFQFRGPELMAFLKEQALKKGVEIIERVMVIDLLTADGKTGAIGFDTRNGEFHVFKAKAIIMATGPINTKMGSVIDNCTGDGVAAGFRVGAELTNMEFCTSGNITVWERKGSASGINMIQGHGAYFVNARGERFMEKYDPVLKERALLYVVCMAFCKETLEGRGPIYVDMRHFSPEVFSKFGKVLPRTMKFWNELGIDPQKKMIDCTASWTVASSSGQGGIKVDKNCETSIPGLYAAGAASRNPIQGIYSVGGVATASCNVMGYIAGENAAKYARALNEVELDLEQIERLRDSAFAPLYSKDGIRSSELFENLKRTIVPAEFSMFKHQNRIIKVLSQIVKVRASLPRVSALDYHELVQANELKNYMICAEMVFRAALEREESRQYHYREEYPYRDDGEWLKLIVFKRLGERITIKHEPIPIEKWSVKPDKFEKISHPIQMFID
jgi:succinate dehydrogenase/fumarate reductase flavoprotein subunit